MFLVGCCLFGFFFFGEGIYIPIFDWDRIQAVCDYDYVIIAPCWASKIILFLPNFLFFIELIIVILLALFSFHLWLSLPVFSPQYSFSQAYVYSDNVGCIFVLKPFSLEPSILLFQCKLVMPSWKLQGKRPGGSEFSVQTHFWLHYQPPALFYILYPQP